MQIFRQRHPIFLWNFRTDGKKIYSRWNEGLHLMEVGIVRSRRLRTLANNRTHDSVKAGSSFSNIGKSFSGAVLPAGRHFGQSFIDVEKLAGYKGRKVCSLRKTEAS